MKRFYRAALRHGAAILFLFALVQFLIGLVPLLYTFLSESGRMASNYGYTPEGSPLQFVMQLQLLFASVAGAVLPFLGALAIDRMDRWLSLKEEEAVRLRRGAS